MLVPQKSLGGDGEVNKSATVNLINWIQRSIEKIEGSAVSRRQCYNFLEPKTAREASLW